MKPSSYLNSIHKQLGYYKKLGERTIAQLTDDQLHLELADDANNISIIVKHMVGNMLSRFTNFLTEDGEKQWRNRDDEFLNTYKTREDIMRAWEKGWKCTFDALESIEDNQLDDLVYIRNEGLSVIEALNRQLAHYAYHVGQIVILGKIHLGANWKSLSIPKGKTTEFNQEKFSIEKGKNKYTDTL